ncbi:MAG TPA: hypothetical protein VJB14_08820 [Planctomycetota bacterium]|nr:hypothetical protein [Planctomycetota bacterium]
MPGGLQANYGIYIPAYATSDGAAIRALATSMSLSEADARMLLASRLPRKVSSTATAELASESVLCLRGAGFDAFAVGFKALRARPPLARTAQWAGDAVDFQPGGAFPIRLIVHGQILSSNQTRSNVAARTQAGGLVPAGSASVSSSDAEPFVHFYGESHARAVELRPRSFNFRFLGAEAGVSKAMGLKNFLVRVRSIYPDARYDETLLHCAVPGDDLDGTETYDEGAAGGLSVRRISHSNEAGALRAALLIALAFLKK